MSVKHVMSAKHVLNHFKKNAVSGCKRALSCSDTVTRSTGEPVALTRSRMVDGTFRVALTVVVVALTLIACGASAASINDDDPITFSAPVPLEVGTPFYLAGEILRFELSLHNIVGGEAVIAVGQPGRMNGRDTIIVRSQSRSLGVAALFKEVSDDVTTWVDLASGHPVQLQADVTFGSKQAYIETIFEGTHPGRFDIAYTKRGRPTRTLRLMIPPSGTYDGNSALGLLRAWQAQVGAQSIFYVLAGRRLWKNTVRAVGHERIKTKLGQVVARRIEGTAWRLDHRLARVKKKKARDYILWVTDDDRRLPIRVVAKTEYGEVKANLVDYQIAPLAARAR